MKGEKVLRPIYEEPRDYEKLEQLLRLVFRRFLYEPLLDEFPKGSGQKRLENAPKDPLKEALASGRIAYRGGAFHGKLNAALSKAIKALGGKWDAHTKRFTLPQSKLPEGCATAIAAGEGRWARTLSAIDKQLQKILPEKIAEKVQAQDLFSSLLWKTDKKLGHTLKGITVPPALSPQARQRIADEWQNNMALWVKDFVAEEITQLRKDVLKSALKGERYETLFRIIQKSYGVSARKAKFLARQETSLLVAKFKETRYTEAGVTEYVWGCVAGSKLHPVRPAHKALEGKKFQWSNPPITTAPGEPPRHNNPGQDYNCRCFAKPVVKF